MRSGTDLVLLVTIAGLPHSEAEGWSFSASGAPAPRRGRSSARVVPRHFQLASDLYSHDQFLPIHEHSSRWQDYDGYQVFCPGWWRGEIFPALYPLTPEMTA
jgi:hypothetical protein